MKYLKLFENFTKEEIDSFCDQYDIKNYTINGDGSIDVDGNVNLSYIGLTDLSLKIINVKKSFYCNNNKLISLDGSPTSVGGNFYCFENKLTSLKGGPESVNGIFNCRSNYITSLEGGPKYITHDLICRNNKIRKFEGFPISLGGVFECINNPVFTLWVLFHNKEKVELFNDFGITDGEVVILDRLNEFLEMIGNRRISNYSISRLEKEGYKII